MNDEELYDAPNDEENTDDGGIIYDDGPLYEEPEIEPEPEPTYTMTLADGTVLSELWLNGNNFMSNDNIPDEVFAGNLETVTIVNDLTGETTVMRDCLKAYTAQLEKDKTNFVIYQRPAAERRQMDSDAMAVDQEFRLTMLELGL